MRGSSRKRSRSRFDAAPDDVREAICWSVILDKSRCWLRAKRSIKSAVHSSARSNACSPARSRAPWRSGRARRAWRGSPLAAACGEDKFDGIRAQLHIGSGNVEIFTRDLKRVTGNSRISAGRAGMPGRAIFDGEILAYAEAESFRFFDLKNGSGQNGGRSFSRSECCAGNYKRSICFGSMANRCANSRSRPGAIRSSCCSPCVFRGRSRFPIHTRLRDRSRLSCGARPRQRRLDRETCLEHVHFPAARYGLGEMEKGVRHARCW